MKVKFLSIALTLTLNAYCGIVLGDNLEIPIRGSVIIEHVSSEADFINTLAVTSPPGLAVAAPGLFRLASNCALATARRLMGVHILSGNRSQPGCRVLLDSDARRLGIQVFPRSGFAGQGSLEFSLCSQEVGRTGCSFTWSSNPSKNIDKLQHVRINLIGFPLGHEEHIFLMSWEDSPQGGDMDFNDLVVRVRVRPCAAQQ